MKSNIIIGNVFRKQSSISRRHLKEVKNNSSHDWDKEDEEYEEEDAVRETAYKIVAYTAVGFSFLAILSVAICMPFVYNFVDHIQRQTRNELNFCKVRERRN